LASAPAPSFAGLAAAPSALAPTPLSALAKWRAKWRPLGGNSVVRGLVQRAVSAPPTPFLLVAAEALWLTTAQWREGGSTTTTISAAHLAASCGPGGLGRAGLRGYRRRTRHSWVAFANTMEFGLVGWGKARRLCACGMAQVLRLLVRLHRWCVNMGRAHTSLCTVHTAPLCELLHRCTVSVSERRRVESVCVTPPQLSTAAWCRSTRATARTVDARSLL